MSHRQPKGEPVEISRFRAVVVATLRAEQLRRGSKPRIQLDGKRHKDTSIAMEEVRRGLITFTQFARPNVQDPATSNLQVVVEPFVPAIG
jgi:DNA-directed RNA polymerase omega subunit